MSTDELKLCNNFRQSFHYFIKSALSFYEIQYTFDHELLHDRLKESQRLIHSIVQQHLTDKSKNRIDNVFNFFSDQNFLQQIFKNNKYAKLMNLIVEDARSLIDEGSL